MAVRDDFVYYADICFKNFGDRVKYWNTINEPNIFCPNAYLKGKYPPGRCSAPFGNCSWGDSEIEPLIVVHNMILSHAKATQIYKKNYQKQQEGYITIVADAGMYFPLSDNEADREAAKRAIAFSAPWILDPVIYGDYPPEMRQLLGDSLPKFSSEETKMVKNSVDFLGFNHYITLYAKDCMHSHCDSGGHAIQGFAYTASERNGIPIGETTGKPGCYIVPYGLEMIIEYLKFRYNNMPMVLLENGMGQTNQPLALHNELLHDIQRVHYLKSYLGAIQRAMRNGADVRGYFIWSLIDNFEWADGYNIRFGIYYVDFQTLNRTEKLSAKWYRDFLLNAAEKLDPQVIQTPKFTGIKLVSHS